MRCPKVHTSSWPVEGIPWAEVAAQTGKFSGTFFGFRVGEGVWVMFEESDDHFPVVIGGCNSESLGVPDEPIGNQVDYRSGLKRHTIVDRRGSRVELSEVGDELHVRLSSGGAEVIVSQIGDEIRISAPSGKITVHGSQVGVNAMHASISAPVVDIDGTGSDRTGLDSGIANVEANERVNVNAQDDLTGLTGEVAIGGHVPISRTAGILVPPVPPKPQQAPLVSLNGRTINIGVGIGGTVPPPLVAADPSRPSDALADFDRAVLPKLPTLSINIRCAASINMNAGGALTLQAGGLLIIENGLTPLQIKSLAAVSVQAPLVDVNSDALTTIRSTVAVAIHAPAINLSTLP